MNCVNSAQCTFIFFYQFLLLFFVLWLKNTSFLSGGGALQHQHEKQ